MEKEYFLGLDLGTNSVGWAVTDRNYKLIKYKGKDMWGIREFEEAATSVERRIKRISRRRRQRQKARMGMLYCYFHDAISEVDPDFYQRLKNSKYHLEDKDENVRYKYGLFHDVDFTDVDYYKQYPTIFHLRKELIENPNPHDVRLVFLAVLNMFKRRGHFLAEGLNAEAATDLKNCYLSVNEKLEVLYDEEVAFAKNVDFVANLLDIDVNQKKIVQRLYEEIEGVLKQQLINELTGLNANVVDLLEKAVFHVPYDVVFEPRMDIGGLLKLFRVKIRNEDLELAEQVIHYIRLMHSILGIKLFVFLNMKMYFSEDELREIYKIASYENIQLLLIEGCQKNSLENEKLWIIDQDLCIIESD